MLNELSFLFCVGVGGRVSQIWQFPLSQVSGIKTTFIPDCFVIVVLYQ